MPKGNHQAIGQPRKDHKRKSLKLAIGLCPIAENSLNGATATIEMGLLIIQTKAIDALAGNKAAIALLAEFGLVAAEGPIVVYKK